MAASRESRIAAVVFDVGGVLSGDLFGELERYCERVGLPPSALIGYFIDDAEFSEVETGRAAVGDFLVALPDRVRDDHGVAIDLAGLLEVMSLSRPLRPTMMSLAGELARSHRVAVLTNNVAENDEFLLQHLAPPVFEFVVNSAAVGWRKPQPEIYTEVLQRLELPAEQVVLVDDLPQNLPPAADLGMSTVLFESESQCRVALRALGAQCSAA